MEDHEKEVDPYNQPNEVYDLMDIDEGVESVIGCETRCENNPATFDAMDVDEGIEVDTDGEKRGQSNEAAFDPMDSGQETDLYTPIDNDYNSKCSAKGSTRVEYAQIGRRNSSSHRSCNSQSMSSPRSIIQLPESWSQSFRGTSSGGMHNRKMARLTSLTYRLLGQDPINCFAENCEKTIADWISLLGKTTLPNNIASSDPSIIAAFRAVDIVICGQQGTHLLRRLAHVQLMRLFISLERIIAHKRASGRLQGARGYRNTCVAMTIYMSARERRSNVKDLEYELKERKRCGRSWTDLARPSPLFVLVYSDLAEPIVKDFKRTDAATLRSVATRVVEACPDGLVRICIQLADRAEWAVRTKRPFDMHQAAAWISQVLLNYS
ncbi:hypothetical protein MKZ38_001458 [Zalerion maritima]|uniref:Uncharacterized protein n=1 Tax=Zalerion maritima TaxID=339359 RepID=A0AAD5RZM4_9PEZI|nr:hypothetical protein MKZ38_001458 [Zalerion maritima]